MNQKAAVAYPTRTSTTRSDRGALPGSAAAKPTAAAETATANNRGAHGIIFYLHRPIGAPLGTVRLSLEDDPAVMGRTSSTTRRTTTSTRRGSYWAVPHPWKDFPKVWQQQRQDRENDNIVEHLELSGNPSSWERLPVDEWAECCQIMSGNATSVALGFGFPKQAQSRQRSFRAPNQQSEPRTLVSSRIRTRVESVRFLDNCPSPEQRQVLLRHVDPRRLEICSDEGTGVRRTLQPILARRNHHGASDKDSSNLHELILHGPVLDVEDCRDVTQLMTACSVPLSTPPSAARTCGGLRRLTLRTVTFASREAWELLLEAMRSSLSLESAAWDHISYYDGSEGRNGNGAPVNTPPQRLDAEDDGTDDCHSGVMKQLKEDLAQLHAFNALHRAACASVRFHHLPYRPSNQRDDDPSESQDSLNVIDSATEVLRQWYLSSTPAASSSSRSNHRPTSSPAPPPQALSVANDPTASTSAKGLTLVSVVRRSRLLSSCS